jgi:hypothetical protein
LHVLFILGVIIPVPLIVVGGLLKWRWVRSFWVRMAHLAMIGFVVAESFVGMRCPLTVWENALRAKAGQAGNGESFIAHWMHELFFYQAPPWVFTVAYATFGLLVAALLVIYPPKRARDH